MKSNTIYKGIKIKYVGQYTNERHFTINGQLFRASSLAEAKRIIDNKENK